MKKFLVALQATLLLAIVFPARTDAADTVRVVAQQAGVHLNADPASRVIATVQAGTVLELKARQGDWLAVWLPAMAPDSQRRLGFLSSSDAELVPEDASVASRQASSASTSARAPSVATPLVKGDVDFLGGATLNLDGARAFVVTNAGTVDSGKHSTLPMFGMSGGVWFGERRRLGIFADVSGVDGGKATAQLGGYKSDVSSTALVDFHVGIQIQAPGRVRPYGYVGTGAAVVKTQGSITYFGSTIGSLDSTETLLSTIVGGGVRFMAGDSWGINVGGGFVSVTRGDSTGTTTGTAVGSYNYGRLVVGLFASFR